MMDSRFTLNLAANLSKDWGPLLESDESIATVWMGASGSMATDVHVIVARHFHKERTLSDVYFRPLRWATNSWLQRAMESASQNNEQALQTHRLQYLSQPVLVYPLAPGASYGERTALCSQTGTQAISRRERSLIRRSFAFRKGSGDLELTTQQILEDLKREAVAAIRSNEPQVFTSVVRDAEKLIVSLIKGSSVKKQTGQLDNFSNLSHRSQVFGRPVYELWMRIWMELFQDASREVASEDDYILELIYVAPRMFRSLDGTATSNILLHLIELQPMLLSKLGEWWVRTLEQQGIMEHGPCDMSSIRPPYSGTYEALIRRYVGAWESLKNEYFLLRSVESAGWSFYQEVAIKFERHLQLSVTMLGECVHRGDRTAAFWINDILLKWISELDFYFEPGVHYGERDKWITFEILERDWDTARSEFDSQVDSFGDENLEKSVLSVALHNYWTDACCLLAYHLTIWGRDCECQKSLPAILLKSLIHGQSLVGGAHAANATSPILNADELLLSILRQRYLDGYGQGYRARLDFLVRRLAGIAEEIMVPGRIYSGIGLEDIDSLQHGQLALLLLVIPKDWKPSKKIDRLLRDWLRIDDNRLRSMASDLDRWKAALGSSSFQSYKNLFDCLLDDSEWEFDDGLNTLVTSIDELSASIDRMRTEALDEFPISDDRLQEIAAWASLTGFSQDTSAFPLPLFGSIQTTTEQDFQQRSCILRRVNKGEYTNPLMAQLPGNEEEFYARVVRNHVGHVLLRDSLLNLELQDVEAASPVRYWDHVAAYAERATAIGYRPILLVENRTRPNWVYEWLSRISEAVEVPEDLEVWRDPQASTNAYIANMNEVAVYLVPWLSPGCSVLMTVESLRSVCFREHPTGKKVVVEAEPIEGETSIINLRLTWAYAMELEQYHCVRLIYRKSTN